MIRIFLMAPRVERQPALAGRFDREHRLSDADVLPDFGNDDGDHAVGRRPQDGLSRSRSSTAKLGSPRSLKSLGMPEADINRAADPA